MAMMMLMMMMMMMMTMMTINDEGQPSSRLFHKKGFGTQSHSGKLLLSAAGRTKSPSTSSPLRKGSCIASKSSAPSGLFSEHGPAKLPGHVRHQHHQLPTSKSRRSHSACTACSKNRSSTFGCRRTSTKNSLKASSERAKSDRCHCEMKPCYLFRLVSVQT